MKNEMILPGQSLLDIALQEVGTLEAAFQIAEQNGLSLMDNLSSGELLKVERNEESRIVKEYEASSIFPATALREGLLPEGIGYMSIETDFIVS